MHRNFENHESPETELTLAEINAISLIERRGVRYAIKTNCQGNKRVLEALDKRDFVKPTNLSEINPQEQQKILSALGADWRKRFIDNNRERQIQHSFRVEFPINSGYTFKLVAVLCMGKEVEIMHPFREIVTLA